MWRQVYLRDILKDIVVGEIDCDETEVLIVNTAELYIDNLLNVEIGTITFLLKEEEEGNIICLKKNG